MCQTIEALYNGDISVYFSHKASDAYILLQQLKQDLNPQLDSEGKEILEQAAKKLYEMRERGERDGFVCGFKLATQLFLEGNSL